MAVFLVSSVLLAANLQNYTHGLRGSRGFEIWQRCGHYVGLGLYIQSSQIHGTNTIVDCAFDSVRSAALEFLNDDVHPTTKK